MQGNSLIDRTTERLLEHLARHPSLLALSFIGLVTGLASGAAIVAFRLLVEQIQDGILPPDEISRFDGLAPELRVFLPVVAGLLIGVLILAFGRKQMVFGVPRLMERLAYHQGYVSAREFVLQFVAAAVALAGGHSVGREGPNIFLGGAAGSLLGQSLKLPHNSIRTMVGSGVAAGIAASFNTPLAGVIFALEVVMMDYTLASFLPMILAAVSANALSIAFFGADPAFSIPPLVLGSLADAPLVAVLAVACGILSALLISLLQRVASFSSHLGFLVRMMLAGLVAGLCGLLLPPVMGVGYDAVTLALTSGFSSGLLAGLLLLKLVATTACIGLGVPGGVIAPTLFLGAMLGALFGQLASMLMPEQAGNAGFYALMGMGAVMGASLQAPLSALTAVVELTHNPEIVMPSMFAIVIAALVTRELFGKESIFITQLRARGLVMADNPIMQALRRAGVGEVMSESFRRVDAQLNRADLLQLKEAQPEWLIIDLPEGKLLMPTLDLLGWLEQQELHDEGLTVDLSEIPARRRQLAPVDLQASLEEARALLEEDAAEALYVRRMNAPGIHRIYGVVTPEQVESAYRL